MPVSVAIVAAALVAGSLVTGPAAVEPGCDVTDATLTWGFKESFRAYIDGDIANGGWTTSGGAGYETPSFEWSNGAGRYDPETGSGFIAFTGSVRFTGHDGLLDTTIADPVVRFDGSSGALLLGVDGVTMDGDMVTQDDVEFLSLPSVEVVGGDAVRTMEAETVLTDQGETAFPNYEAGTAFDPVSITMTVGKLCSTYRADDVQGDASGPGLGPALAVGLTAFGALAAAAIVAVLVLTRRRRSGA